MERRHEGDVLFTVVVVVPLTAKAGDTKIRSEQQLRSRSAECHDDVRPDDSDLSSEEHTALLEIGEFRASCPRRSGFQGVGDEHIIAPQTHRFDHLIQFRPGSFDEGALESFFLGAWRFADEHERGISGALSKDSDPIGLLSSTVWACLGMVLLQSLQPLRLWALGIEKGVIDGDWNRCSAGRAQT